MSLTLIRNYHTDACCEHVEYFNYSGTMKFSGQTVTATHAAGDRYIRPIKSSQVSEDLVGRILYVDYTATNLGKVDHMTEIWSSGSQHAYMISRKYIAFWLGENGSITFREAGIYDKTDWDTLLRDMPKHPNITYLTAPNPYAV